MDIPQPVKEVVSRLRSQGHAAYLVGGCVRDMLLLRAPKDWDVATAARPDRILELFPSAVPVGAHFGVVLWEGVEIATFRSDGEYWDGRRPANVQFESDPRKDAARRDFTVNGMFYDVESAQVLDFVGGQEDLEAKRMKAIGDPDQRFAEDRLRLIRLVRLAAALEFGIDPATASAARSAAPHIKEVAAERIRDELSRILTEGQARRGFELLDEAELLSVILPEIKAMQGVTQPAEYHPEGDVWTHTMMMLGQLSRPSLSLALGVLLHDVGKPPTRTVSDRIRFNGHAEKGAEMAVAMLGRLRFPNDTIAQVRSLVAQHMQFIQAHRMKQSTLKRFLRQPGFDELLEIHRIDCAASNNRFDNYWLCAEFRMALRKDQLAPAPLLSGRDLIEAGVAPGPELGKILRSVEDAQLEGRLKTRDEALAFLRELRPDKAAGVN